MDILVINKRSYLPDAIKIETSITTFSNEVTLNPRLLQRFWWFKVWSSRIDMSSLICILWTGDSVLDMLLKNFKE